MIEHEVAITTPDGTSKGFLFRPDDGEHPGVVFHTDIFGIRQSQKDMASRVAAEGYTVLLPNIFYRSGEPPMFDFKPNFGDEKTMKRFGELTGPLTPEAIERDVGHYVDFLAKQAGVADGSMAALGFCFSGKLSLYAAAARPDRIGLSASFHGGGLCTEDASSPHLLLPRIKARLYLGHANEDRSMPREAIDKLDQALAKWGGKYESEVYTDARHGWTVPDNGAYAKEPAERAYEKLVELLSATLR